MKLRKKSFFGIRMRVFFALCSLPFIMLLVSCTYVFRVLNETKFIPLFAYLNETDT